MSALIASIGGLGLLFNNYTVGSLNLFFFWMTWTTLILSHPPLRVQIFTVLFTRILFFFIPALIFTCFDWVLPKLAGKHEFVQSKGAKTFKVPIGRGKTKELRFSNINKDTVFAIMMTLLNFLLGVAVQAGIEYIATDIFKKDRPLKVTSTLPMPWSMGKSIFYAMLLREVMIYYPHKHIHSTPHSPLRDYHTHPTPTTSSFNHTAVHPIDYLVLQFFPTYIPSVMLSHHLLTHLAFVALVSLVDVITYSQYKYLPTMFFVGRIAKRVRGHYDSKGRSGYGWLGILDWWHGTELPNNEGGIMGMGSGGEDGESFTEAVKKGVRKQREKQRDGSRRRSRRRTRSRAYEDSDSDN